MIWKTTWHEVGKILVYRDTDKNKNVSFLYSSKSFFGLGLPSFLSGKVVSKRTLNTIKHLARVLILSKTKENECTCIKTGWILNYWFVMINHCNTLFLESIDEIITKIIQSDYTTENNDFSKIKCSVIIIFHIVIMTSVVGSDPNLQWKWYQHGIY